MERYAEGSRRLRSGGSSRKRSEEVRNAAERFGRVTGRAWAAAGGIRHAPAISTVVTRWPFEACKAQAII